MGGRRSVEEECDFGQDVRDFIDVMVEIGLRIAGGRQCYDVDLGGKRLSLEDGLARLESPTAAIMERIIKARSLKDRTDEERAALLSSVAIQMGRVPHEDDAKAVALMTLLRPNEQATHIANKSWLLFEMSEATPFYISDNPVIMQNLVEPKGPLQSRNAMM